jgi:hypothetical protein
MQRRTIIVDGPLAFHMRRLEATRAGEIGVEIVSLPLLAARLAGGFVRPALAADVEHAIRGALEVGGFDQIEAACDLPGFVRAAARSLIELWDEGRRLDGEALENAQAADLTLLESRVRAALPTGVLMAVDLRDAALARVEQTGAVLGQIELDGVFYVAPVWRPLLDELQRMSTLTWRNPPSANLAWFSGSTLSTDTAPAATEYLLCANPRAEAIEALRWLRTLLAAGIEPREIGLCAATPEPWDDHFLALAHDAGLPLYFAHGLPVLATHGGQACAALADILLGGLNQERFRRLASYALGQSKLLADLPRTWRAGLSGEARLGDPGQWLAALTNAVAAGCADVRQVLMPAIELIARGKDAAADAGVLLLPPAAQPVWASALRRAPPAAIEQALREIRFADDGDPGACAVWGNAQTLAGAPRAHMRFIGLAAQSWPRRGREDPLLPQHVFARSAPLGVTPPERDRAAFVHLCARASGSCVISRSRRNAQGGRQAPSPLIAHVRRESWQRLRRDRRPEHAFNEADRLLARPLDRQGEPRIAMASTCFVNRRKCELTAHDGLVPADHALVLETLKQPQSATSLKTMLRDPLAYVWRYVLGWDVPHDLASGLGLDDRSYGELLHDLLARIVQQLSAAGGFARASPEDVARVAAEAARTIEREWPLRAAVPPPLLWRHTLDQAVAEARSALRQAVGEGTRSWAELSFGRAADHGHADLPWAPTATVVLEKSHLTVTGVIDRFDRRATGECRVTDYKTGVAPSSLDFKIRGGAELQRVVYTLAVRQLLPDTPSITAVLLYLRGDHGTTCSIANMDASAFLDAVAVAVNVLKSGRTVSGIDAFEAFRDHALAMPAATEGYRIRKARALDRALADLKPVWDLQ